LHQFREHAARGFFVDHRDAEIKNVEQCVAEFCEEEVTFLKDEMPK
jgi:hypothetical protein